LKEGAVLDSDIARFKATRELYEQQLKAFHGERSNLVGDVDAVSEECELRGHHGHAAAGVV